MADTQTRSKFPQITPKIALVSHFPNSHQNPGVGGWVGSHIWENFPNLTVFLGGASLTRNYGDDEENKIKGKARDSMPGDNYDDDDDDASDDDGDDDGNGDDDDGDNDGDNDGDDDFQEVKGEC